MPGRYGEMNAVERKGITNETPIHGLRRCAPAYKFCLGA